MSSNRLEEFEFRALSFPAMLFACIKCGLSFTNSRAWNAHRLTRSCNDATYCQSDEAACGPPNPVVDDCDERPLQSDEDDSSVEPESATDSDDGTTASKLEDILNFEWTNVNYRLLSRLCSELTLSERDAHRLLTTVWLRTLASI